MIETQGLTKRYGSLTALDGLDLNVGKGELFGFIGPNGAGKTTTIHILATLLEPTSGSARVAGIDVRKDGREARRQIGYMPDFFGVYPSLRVWEYLEFFAAAYEVGGERRKTILGDVLELTDLAHKRDALVGTLSRGMQQRLGLARVLIHDPQVLLLDEPASGLDPRARLEVREILRELRNMGKTILLSSHILSELAEICTSIGILLGGKLVTSGSVEKVLTEVGAGRIVRVRVPGDGDDAKSTLLEQLSITDMQVHPQEGETEIEIHLAGEENGPQDIAALLVEAGVPLLHLESARLDLEEAYLRLTDDLEDSSPESPEPSP